MQIILASISERRKELLTQIGFRPNLVLPADIDETPKKAEKPTDYVKRLGIEKAEAVSKKHADGIIIAADTIAAVGRRIIGKAENEKEAFKSLKLMQGRRHNVYTGMCVIKKLNDQIIQKSVKIVKTSVLFKSMSDEEINWYINTKEWVGKSGCFTLMGIGSGFIKAINGSHTNVIGLPLVEARNILIAMGKKPSLLDAVK